MILRLFLAVYSLLFLVGTPLVVAYLYWRGRKDPRYTARLRERFGYVPAIVQGGVWVHAVSLGEVRSALPLVRVLLARGEQVVMTVFTPAGRAEAETVLADAIAQGSVHVFWVPLETAAACRQFLAATRPKAGLVMEIEIWPRMVAAAKTAGVPLFMCNAQYPARSLARDSKGLRLRQRMMRNFAGAFVKSGLQAARFGAVGVPAVVVTGEMRFDQPVPPRLIAAGRRLRDAVAGRPVVTIASAVEGEDALYIGVIRQLLEGPERPFFVYVPRAPERFDAVARMLEEAGIAVARRSRVLDGGLVLREGMGGADVLLGDSLGEMYAWLEMADRVVVGGGFLPSGAHNIIEPLALRRAVIVGPNTGTIEYPAEEAVAAGVCLRVVAEGLADAMSGGFSPDPAMIDEFFAAHSGAAVRTADALEAALRSRRPPVR